jgi:4-amino-4-deoxychorismate lyase
MLVNGSFQEHINLSDRGLAYGDGAFETIRLASGKPVFMTEHLQRLRQTCEVLSIDCDFKKLNDDIEQLSERFSDYGILKIIISRGEGGRGYRPENISEATRILTLHALPDLSDFNANEGVRVFVCKQGLSKEKTLAGIKHLNRLEQVLAAKEWPDDSYFEGLMCDTDGSVIEGTRSNLFFSENGVLYTPSLTQAGVNGVLRQYFLDHLSAEIIVENEITIGRLLLADELFLCNSVIGVWPVKELISEDKNKQFEPGEFSQLAKQMFREALGNF